MEESYFEKYFKVEWPEYQVYMEYPNFRELCGFDPEQNAYYIPQYIIEEIDYKNYPDEIEHNGVIYKTKIDWKKGDEVLFEDEKGHRWTTICTAKGGAGLPDLFANGDDSQNRIPGLNCWVMGVREL